MFDLQLNIKKAIDHLLDASVKLSRCEVLSGRDGSTSAITLTGDGHYRKNLALPANDMALAVETLQAALDYWEKRGDVKINRWEKRAER